MTDETSIGEGPGLFTVGHSNHPLDVFLDLLRTYRIDVLVDVRSYPYSRYVPHFNSDELQNALKHVGIRYLFLGKELGGRPEGDEFYDEDGHALYYRIAESTPFGEGIARLEQGIRRYRVAMMCSEENPAVCHRYLLVSRVMAKQGTRIRHVRGDGTAQLHSDLEAATPSQRSLFDLPAEETWKSLRSVLPRSRPKNSSDSLDVTKSSDWSMSD